MVGRKTKKAWVVAVDMGYGHQRAALPLKNIAIHQEILVANDYSAIPESDKRIWLESRRFYEIISRFKKFPVLGDFVFAIFDKFQEIQEFYPNNVSIDSPTLQVKQIYSLMVKKDWGKHLIQKLNAHPIPFITTFFIPAFMAEFWGYKGKIYVVIPDTDISRAWAPLRPEKSNIVYCASTARVADRLERYGIKKKNIVVTGFPLPEEFTAYHFKKAKRDLRRRLMALDPNRRYISQYKKIVRTYAGKIPEKKRGACQVSLTFAIGGAGAQVDVAEHIIKSVKPMIKDGSLELQLIAGVHGAAATALQDAAKEAGLASMIGKKVHIHVFATKKKYFQEFGKILSSTDILWTKPSELVFYAGLGVPLLLSPPIGSQEKFNRKWLLDIGAGIDQEDPKYTHQWLPDLLEDGVFAEAAMQGFIEISKDGTKNIKKIVCG